MEVGKLSCATIDPDQQWLAAMQDDLDQAQAMLGGVFTDPLPRLPEHIARNPLGAATPALISGLIDVAVITSEITATLDFEDELIQREV